MKSRYSYLAETLFLLAIIAVAFAGIRLWMSLDDPMCTIVQVGTENGTYEREVCR